VIFPKNIVISVVSRSVALASVCTIKGAVRASKKADHVEKKCTEPVFGIVPLGVEQLHAVFTTSIT
jgi:hypothetical protein